MSAPNESSAADPLDAVLAEYLQQVEASTVPDREALLAQHPDLADRLRALLKKGQNSKAGNKMGDPA